MGGRRGAAGVGGAGGGGEGGPGPSPPLRRRSRRGPGARGHWGGRGPEAGAPTAAAEAAAEAAAASVLGPRRSAPWCVDSSPSCCLMESGRWRHRKCLYCPPRSLPAAGMEPIGGCHPARECPAAGERRWGEGEGGRGSGLGRGATQHDLAGLCEAALAPRPGVRARPAVSSQPPSEAQQGGR